MVEDKEEEMTDEMNEESTNRLNLTEWLLGYIAGFVDGEGSIGLKKIGVEGYYGAHVKVVNTNRNILDALMDVTCIGKVSLCGKATEKHKSSYIWRVHSVVDIYCLLLSIEPYLYIKKPQAKLAIDFCTSRIFKGWFDDEKCFTELKRLNRKGSGEEIVE